MRRVLALDPLRERLGLRPRKPLERAQPLPHILFECGCFLDEAFLDPGKPPIEVAHLATEEDVPNLVEIGSTGLFLRGCWCCIRAALRRRLL